MLRLSSVVKLRHPMRMITSICHWVSARQMTAIIYARRKELPLQGVTAHVLRDDSKERQGIYRLDVTLTFHGIEDEASAKRLHEITDRCPIHRLMTASQVEITSHVDLA